MIAAALFGAFLWWRGTLFETRWYLRVVAQTWWIGFVAVIAGWVVTESGRQPWIVQRHPAHRRRHLAGDRAQASPATLVLFVLVYGIVFSIGIYYINRLIAPRAGRPRARSRPKACRSRPLIAAAAWRRARSRCDGRG